MNRTTPLLFVGDQHVADNPPRFCTDAYLEDLWHILEDFIPQTLEELSESVPAQAVLAGDLFHHKAPSRTSHRTVSRLMAAFDSWPSTPLVLAGNHDITHDRLDSIPDSPLGVLLEAEVVELVQPSSRFELGGGHVLAGLPWLGDTVTKDSVMQGIDALNGATVLVAHAPLYPPGQELPFENWDVAALVDLLPQSVTHVYYGHVHDFHGTWTFDAGDRLVTFCNHGAITRGSIAESDLSRPLGVTLFNGEFRFIDYTERLHTPDELFRLAHHQDVSDKRASAGGWVSAVQNIHVAARGMGPMVRALDAIDGDYDEHTRLRARELLHEVGQNE